MGGWFHSMGWGVSTYIFPRDAHMTLEKREKMLGSGLSSLNENHMQESEKKREERRRGQCVTKASL